MFISPAYIPLSIKFAIKYGINTSKITSTVTNIGEAIANFLYSLTDFPKVLNIFINADEHVTATNGLYELKESILQEFKYGTYNKTWNEFFPPILPYLCTINVKFCDSKSTTLVRAADFIANHIYLDVLNNNGYITPDNNMFLVSLPNHKIIQTGLEYFKKT